mmetsp:Transcript_10466/g.11382  ORF Transcript_10466/g.11382 Transcript_10466/m.11382 type:complete len:81 (-) Transcript_10466:177-419(-)
MFSKKKTKNHSENRRHMHTNTKSFFDFIFSLCFVNQKYDCAPRFSVSGVTSKTRPVFRSFSFSSVFNTQNLASDVYILVE